MKEVQSITELDLLGWLKVNNFELTLEGLTGVVLKLLNDGHTVEDLRNDILIYVGDS